MFTEEIIPYLDKYLDTLENKKIKSIIEYSLMGGKCIRGFIVKHIIECSTKNNLIPWEPIVAVELIHAASLVIDDLPCMDNDSERRGKPSTFVKFGKHEAILASFYIISESLRLLSSCFQKKKEPESIYKFTVLINKWCELLGKNLAVGQLMDLHCDVSEYFSIDNTFEFNEALIKFKTSSLFSFTFILAAIFSSPNADINEFSNMGESLGMMYQLVDDYKDRNTDNTSNNYILSHGVQKSVSRYFQARSNLIVLLQKNNLFTTQFKQLIELLDHNFRIKSTPLTSTTQS